MANENKILNLVAQYKQGNIDITALQNGIDAVPNADKTSLGLNQWQLTDKPRMEDFNQDNRILDEKLVELQTNKVDKGEHGTWTPRIFGETTAGTPTYAVQNGTYHTVGGQTICSGTIALSSKGGMAGNVIMAGFPAVSRFTVTGPFNNSHGLSLGAGITLTGSVLYTDYARLLVQSSSNSGFLTADMITDNFAAYYFTFVYASN